MIPFFVVQINLSIKIIRCDWEDIFIFTLFDIWWENMYFFFLFFVVWNNLDLFDGQNKE